MSDRTERKLASLQRRQQIADLYLQGLSQTHIAQRIKVDQATVQRDLAKVRTAWRESSIRDFDAARDLELERLNKIERESWDAWERSQKPSQSADIRDDQPNGQSRKRIKNQYGDPRFLELALRCNDARCRLLGLNAPTKIAPVISDYDKPLTHEERQMHINAIIAEMMGQSSQAPPLALEAVFEDDDKDEETDDGLQKNS